VTEERGRWYLLTGFVIGVLLGLTVAWVAVPRDHQDTSPASLRSNFKDEYRAMIAAAYVANGNLPRAKARLDLLQDADAVRTLAEQAQRTLAEGRSPRQAQALGLLAVALGQGPAPALSSPSPALTAAASTASATAPSETSLPASPPNPSPTALLSPSPAGQTQTPASTTTSISNGTPLSTRTPTSIAQEPWVLKDKTFVCDQTLAGPLLQVVVENQGQPQPGVEAVVRWEGGEDHFFTGVKPEMGLGYADYTMQPGVEYTLQLVGGGQPVPNLTAAECETTSGSRYWGSWLLAFSQPE
jgi:hypothetical protein